MLQDMAPQLPGTLLGANVREGTREDGMAERVVKANGIEIWTEDFGDPNAAPVLLIMGATVQAIFWDERFCERLVEGGRYVARDRRRDSAGLQLGA